MVILCYLYSSTVMFFVLLYCYVFHDDTGLRKELGNRDTREKCNISTATLAEDNWAGTAVWPHSAISQYFPKWPT